MRQLANHLAAAGIVALVATPAFADQVFYKTGTTQEICPLTGLSDPADRDGKKFGVVGTDLGYSFVHKGQLFFLFGDTNGRQGTAVDPSVEEGPNPVVNLDSIASFNGTDPNRLCTDLAFVLDPNRPGTYLPPQVALSPVYIDHIGHGTFRVPAAGFSWNNTMYVFFSRLSADATSEGPAGIRRSILAKSADDGKTFQYVSEISKDKFINFSAVVVNNSEIAGLPSDNLGTSGNGVLLFASGRYRLSAPFLAYVPLEPDGPKLPQAWSYFSGLSGGNPIWVTGSEAAAASLFSDLESFGPCVASANCIGEMSVAWNPYLHKWLMLYNAGEAILDPQGHNFTKARGIRFHVADKPWGPWSDLVWSFADPIIKVDATVSPSLVFEPNRDNGYTHFMHLILPADPPRSCTKPFDSSNPSSSPDCVGNDICSVAIDKDNKHFCLHSYDNLYDSSFGTLSIVAGETIYQSNGPRIPEAGGEYGPFMIPGLATGDSNKGTTTIYYTMSTWNPYEAFLMRSDLRLERPPVAKAGATQTVSVGSNCTAQVTLDGSGSSDPDSDPLTYSWTWPPNGSAGGRNPTVTLPLGTTTVTLTVSDGFPGGTTTDKVVITTKDTTPPVVSESVGLPALWTPDHTLVNVGLASTATDNCDGARPVTVSVFGNEDDQDPTGDGTFSPDAKDIAPGTLRLRSERKGNGSGRVYLIRSSATDLAGNVGINCATVTVPHDNTAASIAVVTTQAANARAYCLSRSGAVPPGYFVIGDGPVIGPIQ
jgi:hypothetical protein